jgi:hypothetical protein
MRTLLILLTFSIVLCATAQAQTITGRVTNPKGEPVSFATVKVKSSKITVAADADGLFKIKASTGQTLVISAANYATREIVVQNPENVAVTLAVQEASLSEVVVMHWGNRRTKRKWVIQLQLLILPPSIKMRR